jgi:hypothetical protein
MPKTPRRHADQRPRILPKSALGEAVTYATNQAPALAVYLLMAARRSPTGLPSRQSARWGSGGAASSCT